MSAGYDSRVLLAAALASGFSPADGRQRACVIVAASRRWKWLVGGQDYELANPRSPHRCQGHQGGQPPPWASPRLGGGAACVSVVTALGRRGVRPGNLSITAEQPRRVGEEGRLHLPARKTRGHLAETGCPRKTIVEELCGKVEIIASGRRARCLAKASASVDT